MRRHGKTRRGTLRFFCPGCKRTAVRTRADTKERHERNRVRRWLTGKNSLTELGNFYQETRQTLSRRFRQFFLRVAKWQVPERISILVMDGIFIHSHSLLALIGLADGQKLVWSFAEQETTGNWLALLRLLPRPQVVVCDGHNGLLACLRALWPGIAIQRCHFHVVKLTRVYLSRRPKTIAGQELWALVKTLACCRTPEKAEWFRQSFLAWCVKYEVFFAERSFSFNERGRKHWWYTHKRLRGARSLIQNALPHLFTFLNYPNCPNTTNQVEGGINTQIAEATRLHRSLRQYQKQTLVSLILAGINQQKATQNVT